MPCKHQIGFLRNSSGNDGAFARCKRTLSLRHAFGDVIYVHILVEIICFSDLFIK